MANFDVSNFVANINGATAGGLARANMFRVKITAPGTITETRSKGLGGATEGYDLLVKGAQIPGATIAPLPVNYGGRIIKLTGFRTFDNWTVTVLNDEEFAHRKWIQDWMYAIAGQPDGERKFIKDNKLYNLATTASISLYNNTGAATNSWQMYNMWPTTLGDITLDWGTDGIQEYSVDFAYEYWTEGSGVADTTDATKVLDHVTNVIDGSVPT